MKTESIKDVVYWWFNFLSGKRPQTDKDYELFKLFFPHLVENSENDEKLWSTVQNVVSKMWWYKTSDDHHRKLSKFRLISQNICQHLDCPIKGFHQNTEDSDEYFNLIIGPQGHHAGGDAEDFVKLILERLRLQGKPTEVFFYDSYLVKSLTKGNSQNFTKDFLEGLKNELESLVGVTKEIVDFNLATLNVPIKRVPEGVFHDRFLIAYDDNCWKGILIGTSVNSFPNKGSGFTKPHFIISNLEKEDAIRLAEILKDNLI